MQDAAGAGMLTQQLLISGCLDLGQQRYVTVLGQCEAQDFDWIGTVDPQGPVSQSKGGGPSVFTCLWGLWHSPCSCLLFEPFPALLLPHLASVFTQCPFCSAFSSQKDSPIGSSIRPPHLNSSYLQRPQFLIKSLRRDQDICQVLATMTKCQREMI